MNKFLFTLGVVFAMATANASYLYWQVSESDVDSSLTDWNAARVYYTNGAGDTGYFSTTYDSDTSPHEFVAVPSGTQFVTDLNGHEGTGYSYFIELYNYNSSNPQSSTFVGQSSALAYDTNSTYINNGSTTGSMTEIPSASLASWHGGGYSSAPEPTSAVMMMFAAAVLGLKRRKMARSVA